MPWYTMVLAFVVVLAVAVLASKESTIAKVIQYGIIIAIVVVVLRNTDQLVTLTDRLRESMTGAITNAKEGKSNDS